MVEEVSGPAVALWSEAKPGSCRREVGLLSMDWPKARMGGKAVPPDEALRGLPQPAEPPAKSE